MNFLRSEAFEQHSLTWSDLFALSQKYLWLILAVFLGGTVGTWLTLQVFFTEQYETKVSLLVKVGRENTEVPAIVQKGQFLSQGVRIADINSEVQMLQSRALIEVVVDRLGTEKFKFEIPKPESLWGYPRYYLRHVARSVKSVYKELLIVAGLKKRLTPREQTILAVAKGLKVEPVKESDVLVLKVRLPSPSLCVEVANTLLHFYLERRIEVRRTFAGMDFFDVQVTEHRKRLQQLERLRAEARRRWAISSPGEQRTLLLKQLADIQSESIRNQAEIAMLQQQLATMRTNLEKTSDLLLKEQVSTQNPSIQSIKERITALHLERAKIASRYLPDSEPVKKVEEEIAELQRAVAEEKPTILASVTSELNPVRREFKQEIEHHVTKMAGLEARQQHLKEPAENIVSELGRINTGSDAYEAIEREYRLAEQDYVTYSKRREEARISEELDGRRVANVTAMSPPEMPIEPVYPRKLFIMAIGLPLWLVVGIAVAALFETMDDRISTDRDLDAIGNLDYLGTFRVYEEALNGGVVSTATSCKE